MIVLGIDTSCDDTSLAVLEDGKKILSEIVSSQVDVHRLFGGVVPELASRKHVELIDAIYEEVVDQAGINGGQIDGIAVTAGPGLIGSLLVGLCFAKGLALAIDRPLVGVNHIQAHTMSICLEREVVFPFVALVVSGGHTVILLVENRREFKVLGTTRDDAAGEAFDKIAKLLGIGYPGGKAIESIARGGDRSYVAFPRPMMEEGNLDFSFSGLKTAVVNYVKKNGVSDEGLPHVLSSFQEAVVDVLSTKTVMAARNCGVSQVVVGGGVASNGRLREVLSARAASEGISAYFSSPRFCTDNGAMVALVGSWDLEQGRPTDLGIKAFSRMRLR